MTVRHVTIQSIRSRTRRPLLTAVTTLVLLSALTGPASAHSLTDSPAGYGSISPPPAPAAQPSAGSAERGTSVRAERAAYHRYATASARVLDLSGAESSAYRGRYFRPATEVTRLCIFQRESNSSYRSTNRSGGYFGGYQMSRALAVGATWMMLDEHRTLMGAKRARATLARLRATEPHRWNRYWQDAAFYTVYNWNGNGSGANHWAGGRWRC